MSKNSNSRSGFACAESSHIHWAITDPNHSRQSARSKHLNNPQTDAEPSQASCDLLRIHAGNQVGKGLICFSRASLRMEIILSRGYTYRCIPITARLLMGKILVLYLIELVRHRSL